MIMSSLLGFFFNIPVNLHSRSMLIVKNYKDHYLNQFKLISNLGNWFKLSLRSGEMRRRMCKHRIGLMLCHLASLVNFCLFVSFFFDFGNVK